MYNDKESCIWYNKENIYDVKEERFVLWNKIWWYCLHPRNAVTIFFIPEDNFNYDVFRVWPADYNTIHEITVTTNYIKLRKLML